jgi:hypothetical protein
MFTDERIHAYCRNKEIQNNSIRKLVQVSNSSQIVLNGGYDYVQNHLNDEIKNNLVNLLASYWDNIFESIKLANIYWRRIFNISN